MARLCSGEFLPSRGPYLVLPGDETKLKLWGVSPCEAGGGVADLAGDGLVGPAALVGMGRRDVAGQEGDGGVAAVAAGLDPGHDAVLLRVGHGQLEILDLVPVVRVGLGHHGLLPLPVDIGVAGRAAELRRLVVGVLARAERGVAGLGRLGRGQAEEQDDGADENDGERGSFHGDLLRTGHRALILPEDGGQKKGGTRTPGTCPRSRSPEGDRGAIRRSWPR